MSINEPRLLPQGPDRGGLELRVHCRVSRVVGGEQGRRLPGQQPGTAAILASLHRALVLHRSGGFADSAETEY